MSFNLSSSFYKRVTTALFLLPIVLFIEYYGGWLAAAFLTSILGVACYEWSKLKTDNRIIRAVVLLQIVVGMYFFYDFTYSFSFSVLISFLVALWASDVFAYVFGKTFKGPKMIPKVSPNKTWAGMLGAVTGPAVALFLFYPDQILISIVFGIVLGVTGQIGDLLISYLKRCAGVKDTGALFPGHGGVLDRIDSLLFAAPFFMIFCVFAGIV